MSVWLRLIAAVFFALLGSGTLAVCAGNNADSEILQFPKQSAGHLYAIANGANWIQPSDQSMKPAGEAQGPVRKPKGSSFLLYLSYAGANDLSFLTKLPADALAGIDHKGSLVDCSKLSSLQAQKGLRRLAMRDTDFEDKDCAYLKNLPLEFLDLSRTLIKGSGLGVIDTLKHLDTLSLSNDPLAPGATDHLIHAPKLAALHIRNTNLKDKDLANLAQIKTLKLLKISGNAQITDAGIAYLAKLPALEQLDCSDSNVTLKCLESLKKMKKLSQLDIHCAKLTVSDIVKIKTALPHCAVAGGIGTHMDPTLFAPLH